MHFVYFSTCLCTYLYCLHLLSFFKSTPPPSALNLFIHLYLLSLSYQYYTFRFYLYFSIVAPLNHRAFSTCTFTPLLLYLPKTLIFQMYSAYSPPLSLSTWTFALLCLLAHSSSFYLCIRSLPLYSLSSFLSHFPPNLLLCQHGRSPYVHHPILSIFSIFSHTISNFFICTLPLHYHCPFFSCTCLIFPFVCPLHLLIVLLGNHK